MNLTKSKLLKTQIYTKLILLIKMNYLNYSEDMYDNCMAAHDLMDHYINNPSNRSFLEEAEPIIQSLGTKCFVTTGLFRNLNKRFQ